MLDFGVKFTNSYKSNESLILVCTCCVPNWDFVSGQHTGELI